MDAKEKLLDDYLKENENIQYQIINEEGGKAVDIDSCTPEQLSYIMDIFKD